MGFRERIGRLAKGVTGAHADGIAELQVGNPVYDGWPVVRDFEELDAARAWRQQLTELGLEAVLTADWEPDEHGRGDIALRVPQDQYADASNALEPDF
jgi:hypothetical protein